MRNLKKHFVTFLSPGTFVAETSSREIDAWDVAAAQEMASGISERYGAVPYGFRFTTRERGDGDLDSKETDRSGVYYLPHCVAKTVADLRAENNPQNSTLIANMEGNGWDRVVQTTDGWQWTQPLRAEDVVLGS